MRQIINFKKYFEPLQVRASTDTENLGVIPMRRCWEIADQLGLDVVGIQSQSNPPVIKITDYGKFKYAQQLQAKEAKAKAKASQVKLHEIKIKPGIDTRDLEIKVGKIKEFLLAGDKVKFIMSFRGRENAHPEIGHRIVVQVLEDLKTLCVVEQRPTSEGRSILTILAPLRK